MLLQGEVQVGGIVRRQGVIASQADERAHVIHGHPSGDRQRQIGEQIQEAGDISPRDPPTPLCDEEHVGDFERPERRNAVSKLRVKRNDPTGTYVVQAHTSLDSAIFGDVPASFDVQ